MCKNPLSIGPALVLLFPVLVFAEMRVELIELPPDTGELAAEGAGGARLSTLSERFAGTGLGRHFVRLSPEKPFSAAGEALLYTDPLLLSRTSPAHTSVVVDLKKRRTYLMVGNRMALETEACVHQFGQTTPAGCFAMSDRIKNGPIAEGLRTSAPYWMKLGATGFGLHGGHLYGYPAAGGCVRLPLPAAEIVFEKTQEGTPVAVFESWARDTYTPPEPGVPAAKEELPAPDLAAAPSPKRGQPKAAVAAVQQVPSALPAASAPAPVAAVRAVPILRPVSGSANAAPAEAFPPIEILPPLPQPAAPVAPTAGPAPSSGSPAKLRSAGADDEPPTARTAAENGEPDSPEVARFRKLFRPPANPPARNPLFPSEKHLKRLDLNAARAGKPGAAGAGTGAAER